MSGKSPLSLSLLSVGYISYIMQHRGFPIIPLPLPFHRNIQPSTCELSSKEWTTVLHTNSISHMHAELSLISTVKKSTAIIFPFHHPSPRTRLPHTAKVDLSRSFEMVFIWTPPPWSLLWNIMLSQTKRGNWQGFRPGWPLCLLPHVQTGQAGIINMVWLNDWMIEWLNDWMIELSIMNSIDRLFLIHRYPFQVLRSHGYHLIIFSTEFHWSHYGF